MVEGREGGFGGWDQQLRLMTAEETQASNRRIFIFLNKPKFWRKVRREGGGREGREGGWDLFGSIIPFLSFIFGRERAVSCPDFSTTDFFFVVYNPHFTSVVL